MVASREIRIVTDPKAQRAESYRYWQSRTIAERFAGVIQATQDAYALAGKSFDASHRSERTLRVIQRKRG